MTIVMPQSEPCSARKCHVVALTADREEGWSNFVRNHTGSTVFHTIEWHSAVRNAFHHAPEYLMALRGGRVAGVLPMFLVRGPLIGRMLVSVPYAVGGGILADDDEAEVELFLAAHRIATEQRCAMIDFRSEHAAVATLPIVDQYVGFERHLPRSVGEVAQWLPRKARAVVRNARDKYGLTCDFSPQLLPVVWELYCRNMRRLASINYPYRFFASLLDEFRERCWVCVVRREARPVAGLVTFLFRDRVLPYFFGCAAEARACGAANFAYSCVMERAVAENFRIFDFGRSRRDNHGSCDFKRFHGFEPRPLEYQRYFVAAQRPVDLTPTNPAFELARRVWPHLPLAVTRPAGALLSRYIPG